MKLLYHPGKANVVVDALSRKSYANILESKGLPKELAENIMELDLEIVPRGFVVAMVYIIGKDLRNSKGG